MGCPSGRSTVGTRATLDSGAASCASTGRILVVMSSDVEMVTIPKAELEAMQAELRRLRLEAGRAEALRRLQADPGPGPGDTARVFTTREELAEALGLRA